MVREARRDVTSGTTGTLLFGLVATAVISGLALWELLVIHQLTIQAQEYRQAGAAVSIIRAEDSIDGVTCEALGRLPGVTAGAFRQAETNLVPAELPASSLATYEVTPGMAAVLDTNVSGPGVLLPTPAAETLGVATGEQLDLETGSTTVAGVYRWDEDDGRRPGLGYAVLVPQVAQSLYDECWFSSWPQMPFLDRLAALSVISTQDDQVAVERTQLNSSLGATFAGEKQFTNRPTRYAPIGVAAAALAIGFVAVRRRKLELASDLHAGVSRTDLTCKLLLETTSWALPAGLLLLPTVAWLAAHGPSQDRAAMLSYGALLALMGVLGCLVGAYLATVMTREAHLNRYFKTR